MTQITLNIEERKIEFFMELIENLDFVNVELEEAGVMEWHKKIVQERLEAYKLNPDSAIEFDSAIDEIEKELWCLRFLNFRLQKETFKNLRCITIRSCQA